MNKGDTIPVLDHGYVRYVDHMGDDQRILEAARVSYKSASKGPEADKKLLFYLWKNKHTSPFEMVKVMFNIKMPIFVARQFMRHRMQNLNEVSARYTELPGEFYVPKWRTQSSENRQGTDFVSDWNPTIHECGGERISATAALQNHCQVAYEVYHAMLKAGIGRELARLVLPLNTYTEFYSCWDMNNLLRFIRLREDPHAQWEIQEYARAMKTVCYSLFPWTMEAFATFK